MFAFSDLLFFIFKMNDEKCFKVMDLLYLSATGPFICGRNAIDVKGLNPSS
ncbi:hypothetical protein ACSBR2_012263 [Camellia fascicularis]